MPFDTNVGPVKDPNFNQGFADRISFLAPYFTANANDATKGPNNKKVPGFANVTVSDNLKEVLMKKQVTHKIKLSEGEKMFLHKLVGKNDADIGESKQKGISHTISESPKELNHQLNILFGEIHAGNDNPVIVDQIETILNKLVSTGSITQKQAKTLYKSI